MPYTDLSHPDLVQACIASDNDAWKEFQRRYQRVIGLAVLRTAQRWKGASKSLVEDLIGDTYLKLCDKHFALLRNFEFRTEAGLYGYLKKVATNVVHDHFRRKSTPKSGMEADIEDVYEAADPSKPDGPEAMERQVLIKEIAAVLEVVTCGADAERDRTIFWLYFRQGFSANAIAALPFIKELTAKGKDLTTEGIESVIHRLTKAVRGRLTDKTAAFTVAQPEKGVSEGSSF
jgi:RNA polymerase sigma-70 factor, ECF subfamily